MIEMSIKLLLSWLPTPLFIMCIGVVSIFFIMTLLRLIAFILDLIPFL